MATQAPRAYKGVAKMIVYAGNGKPNPKMGQALGPLGLNMMQFCKDFNDRTSQFRNDVPLRVVLKAYTDRTYTFIVKPPPTSWLLKRCAMNTQGSNLAKKRYNMEVGVKYIYEIAKLKQSLDPHLKRHNLYGLCRMIMAQADNMGVRVVGETVHPTPIATKKI
jgi:large subunit ribosomal protein L11